jgi:hypothetical protein
MVRAAAPVLLLAAQARRDQLGPGATELLEDPVLDDERRHHEQRRRAGSDLLAHFLDEPIVDTHVGHRAGVGAHRRPPTAIPSSGTKNSRPNHPLAAGSA